MDPLIPEPRTAPGIPCMTRALMQEADEGLYVLLEMGLPVTKYEERVFDLEADAWIEGMVFIKMLRVRPPGRPAPGRGALEIIPRDNGAGDIVIAWAALPMYDHFRRES